MFYEKKNAHVTVNRSVEPRAKILFIHIIGTAAAAFWRFYREQMFFIAVILSIIFYVCVNIRVGHVRPARRRKCSRRRRPLRRPYLPRSRP